jgi:proline dehydrogenase
MVEPREVAYPFGEQTDVAFLRLARQLHAGGVRLAIGTHDPVLREALLGGLDAIGVEMLLGVRPGDGHELLRRGHRVRIYVPFGPDWFRYWLRRLGEARGA